MVKQSYQEIDRIHTKDAMWLVFHMVLYFAIWLWVFLSGPRGCVLAFNVLYATHILMNYMLSKNNHVEIHLERNTIVKLKYFDATSYMSSIDNDYEALTYINHVITHR